MALEFLQPSAVANRMVESPFRVYDGDDIHLEGVKIAIVGVGEERGYPANKGCKAGPEEVRAALYKLRSFPLNTTVADLGNIPAGHTHGDTQAALAEVVDDLLRQGIIPIIIGGDQSLAYGQFRGYQKQEQMVNLTLVDERFSLHEGKGGSQVQREEYLYKILTHRPAFLFNFVALGYQGYFIYQEHLELMNKLHFEYLRAGKIREDHREMEPYIRDTDMLVLNIAALRSSDAPGFCEPSPNGLFADEACQLMWYAGVSDKVNSVGLYDFNPAYDQKGQTALAVAQMIWYFIFGYSQRKADYPITSDRDFNKFIVTLEDRDEDITFLKSKKSDRWWMVIPKGKGKNKRRVLVSCTYRDYQQTLDGELPERFVKALNRLE